VTKIVILERHTHLPMTGLNGSFFKTRLLRFEVSLMIGRLKECLFELQIRYGVDLCDLSYIMTGA